MLTSLKNFFLNKNRYREHPEAVIISSFFNSENSPYRVKAFNQFYDSIKHMDHMIMECVIGNGKPQLLKNDNIQVVHTENLLWHKESLLNLAVTRLPKKYKYVFWVDADLLFTNKDWLVDSVAELKSGASILQPFEYCLHLDKDQVKPPIDYVKHYKDFVETDTRYPKLWRSFCANYVTRPGASESKDYNIHGHVGFAWAAKREVLEACPLYDRALIGGGDHIIAHAAAGQFPHHCINKSFTDDLDAVYDWSKKFYEVVQGKIAYTEGNVYHLWHGDIRKREYLKRVQEFTPETKKIVEKDDNGLYVTKNGDSPYIKEYFDRREVKVGTTPKVKPASKKIDYVHTQTKYVSPPSPAHNDGFTDSMALAYMSDSPMLGTVLGGNPAGAMIGGMMADSNKHSHSVNDVPPPQGNYRPHHEYNIPSEDSVDASENFS